jgi:uncharacterized protein with GYD domain
VPTYTSLANVRERDVQNVQELASIWGELRTEVADFDAELHDTYAVLGDYDFIVHFEAADRDEAFKIALAMERHGLDMQTMEVIPTEHFAELVDDV